MKYIYTAIFVPNEDSSKYYCRIPDLPGCITTGDSLDNAIEMMTDAASGWLVVAEDEGNDIPEATPQCNLDIPENATYSIIRIDTLSYRAATDTRTPEVLPEPGELEALEEGRKDRLKNGTIPHEAVNWE